MSSLKITTYNTHLFLGTALGAAPEYEDETRLEMLIKQLRKSKSDVITLCEVWADSSKEKLIKELCGKFPYSYYPKKKNNPLKLGAGLLLLSKHEVIDSSFTQFEDLVSSDRWSQKGFIEAKLKYGPNDLIYILTTHTQSGNNSDEIQARKNNFQQIYNSIRDINLSIPVFVTGDFNVIGEYHKGAETDEYRTLKKNFGVQGFVDAYRTLYKQAKINHGFTYNGYKNKLIPIFEPKDYNVQQRLDYIFINQAAANVVIDDLKVDKNYLYSDTKEPRLMDISDHYPISAKFSFL